MNRIILDAKTPKYGSIPAIILEDSKYPHNVGMIVRLASCYGIQQVWFTGKRVMLDLAGGMRLPREERMKGYQEVEIIQHGYPLEQFASPAVPVAVEVRESSVPLHLFEHPQNAVYVFGPEDGSLSKAILARCHHFVVIPTRHCLNVAMAVSAILWDRQYKEWLSGNEESFSTPGEWEGRGFIEAPSDLVPKWGD